jgi:peptide-methionine (S)-S-oxide reductase
MFRNVIRALAVVAAGLAVASFVSRRQSNRAAAAVPIPAPIATLGLANPASFQTAVLAGGCFWGIEAVYEHMKGVIDVVSGYAGGSADSADYELVGTGRSGHAESVRITFDPSKITYGQILQIFFSVAHDPTELNRQGPDIGPQYRSAIFYTDEAQARVAREYVQQLTQQGIFSRPVVTEIVALKAFYPAEEYHQNYAERHPNQPYIVFNDRPKVERLRKQFPALYREVGAAK